MKKGRNSRVPALSSRQPSIAAPSATSLLRRLSEVERLDIRSTASHCGLKIVGWLSIIIEYYLVCDEGYEVWRGSLTDNQERLCGRYAIHTVGQVAGCFVAYRDEPILITRF